jgi:hypothetical protein
MPLPVLKTKFHLRVFAYGFIVLSVLIYGLYVLNLYVQKNRTLELHEAQKQKQIVTLQGNVDALGSRIASLSAQITMLETEDQRVTNKNLNNEITHIHDTYKQAVNVYEQLLDLKDITKDTSKLDTQFALSLNLLSQKSWASAAATLSSLSTSITQTKDKITASFVIPVSVPVNNTAPGSGYSRQTVHADIGDYLVDIIAADMGSTRVIVDTASNGDCRDNCPVLALGDYVARSGAYAGVNGAYFCPATYPQCAGKTNSFDTLLMNKNKVYFNSDNNVYSIVPAVIFLSGSMRFVGRSLDWGRDTSPDGVIANQPLLLSGGNIAFGGNDDPKQGSKGNRSFVGNKGSTAYIGVVHNATVAEVAHVLKALGLEGALNLDSGGSTALWSSGYKVGPGRNIPNAILFVRK